MINHTFTVLSVAAFAFGLGLTWKVFKIDYLKQTCWILFLDPYHVARYMPVIQWWIRVIDLFRLVWESSLIDNLLNFAGTPKGLLLLQQTGKMNECVAYMNERYNKKLQVQKRVLLYHLHFHFILHLHLKLQYLT